MRQTLNGIGSIIAQFEKNTRTFVPVFLCKSFCSAGGMPVRHPAPFPPEFATCSLILIKFFSYFV
ncbi:MAG: hypothetical protein Q4G52_12250, partial [Clostridia bacterium]|nr:hypothetical protein [Clostridia bacterium]